MSKTVPFVDTAGPLPQAGRLALVSGATVFIWLAVIMTTSAFYLLFVAPSEDKAVIEVTARNSPAYLGLWMLLYLWAALIVVRDVMARGISIGALPLLAFGALALISVCWSPGSSRTMIYATMLTGNFVIGYALAVLMSPGRFLNHLTVIFSFLLVASLVMVIVAPELASNARWGGAWLGKQQLNGVFAHKSDAGYNFAALSLLIVHGTILHPRPISRIVLFLTAAVAILMTNSATGLVAALALNLAIVVGKRLGPLRAYILPLAASGCVIFSIVLPLIDIGSLVGVVGRESTLTGRVPIWNLGLTFFYQKPLLGYGYGGFFDLSTYSPAWQLWKEFTYFKTPHFHNSAIEMLTSLGIIGLGGYVVLLACAFTVFGNRTIARDSTDLIAGLMILFVISAAFDFTIMKHNAFATALLAYTCVAAQRRYD